MPTVVLGLASATHAGLALTRISRRTPGIATSANAGLALTRRRVTSIGQPSETDTTFALTPARGDALELAEEVGDVLALTVLRSLNGSFANRDDISNENGDLPITNLVLSNTEAGEYTNGLVATLWYVYTAADVPPGAVTWSFSWAGQSGSGGAGIRLYSDNNDPAIPTVAELLDSDDENGASGTVSITFSPTASVTYYLQIGIQEKAGTTSHLSQRNLLATPPTFTAVIP